MQLISPILAKDLRPLLRSRKAFWLMLAMLICVGGLLVLIFSQFERYATISMRSHVGRELFLTISLAQICCFGLFAPALTASSISLERETRTFDLLEATTLSRFDILWNKWWAAIAFIVLAALLLLPIETMLFQLGGVGQDEVSAAIALLLAAILAYGMMGLAISSAFRRSAGALVLTLALVLLLNIGLPLSLLVLDEFNIIPFSERELVRFTGNFSIVIAFVEKVGRSPARGGMPISLLHQIAGLLYFHAFLFVACAWIAWRNLRRVESLKVPVAGKLIDDPHLLEMRRKEFPFYLIDPMARAHHIPDGADPVLVREQRTGALSRPVALIRICYVAIFFSMAYGLQEIIFRPNLAPFRFAIILMATGAVAIPAFAALAVSKERESGTLDLLLAAPVRPMRIVSAKYRAALRFMVYFCVSFLALPFGIYLLHFGTPFWEKIRYASLSLAIIVPYLAAFFSLFAALGIFTSCISKRTSTALIMTYLAIAGLAILPILIGFILSVAIDPNMSFYTNNRGLVEFGARAMSPVIYFMDTGASERRMMMPGKILKLVFSAALTFWMSRLILKMAAAALARRTRS